MEVFSTHVLFEAKQPMHHIHFAEVAVEASTNDTWVSNYAFISRPNALKFFTKKKKKTWSSIKKILFAIRSLWCFQLIIIFNGMGTIFYIIVSLPPFVSVVFLFINSTMRGAQEGKERRRPAFSAFLTICARVFLFHLKPACGTQEENGSGHSKSLLKLPPWVQ